MHRISDLEITGYNVERDGIDVQRNLQHADMYVGSQDNPLQLHGFVESLPTAVIVGRFPDCDRVEASMYIPDSVIPLLARYALHPIYDEYPDHADMITATMYNAAFKVLRDRGAPHVEDLYDVNGLHSSTWKALGFEERYRLQGTQRELWHPDGQPVANLSVQPDSGLIVEAYNADRDGAGIQRNMQQAGMYVAAQDNPNRLADITSRTPDAVIVARYEGSDEVEGSLTVCNSPIPLVARYVKHPRYADQPEREDVLTRTLFNKAFDTLRSRGAPHIEALYDVGVRSYTWRRLGFTAQYDIIGTQRELWQPDGTPTPDIALPTDPVGGPYWDRKFQPIKL